MADMQIDCLARTQQAIELMGHFVFISVLIVIMFTLLGLCIIIVGGWVRDLFAFHGKKTVIDSIMLLMTRLCLIVKL